MSPVIFSVAFLKKLQIFSNKYQNNWRLASPEKNLAIYNIVHTPHFPEFWNIPTVKNSWFSICDLTIERGKLSAELLFHMLSPRLEYLMLGNSYISTTLESPVAFKDIVSHIPNIQSLGINNIFEIEIDEDWPLILMEQCKKLSLIRLQCPLSCLNGKKIAQMITQFLPRKVKIILKI